MPVTENPDGSVTITGNVHIEGDLHIEGNLTGTGMIFFQNHRGHLEWGHPSRINELSAIGYDDTGGFRAGMKGDPRGSALGKFSINWVRPDGVHEEVTMTLGTTKDDERGTLSGQMLQYAKDGRVSDDDQSMVLVAAATAAYTDDERLIFFARDTQEGGIFNTYPAHDRSPVTIGSPPPPPPSEPDEPSSPGDLLATENARLGNGIWRAVNQNDNMMIRKRVSGPVTIYAQRTQSGGDPPYLYVDVNGARTVDEARPNSAGAYPLSTVDDDVVEVRVSAQGGVLDIEDF